MYFITDRSKAVVLMWSLLDVLVARVSVMFHFMFVHYTFSSVWVAWGIAARLAICSHCILSNCYIYLFPALVLRAGFAF